MLVESRDSTCVLKAEPGKLDINRPIPGITLLDYPLDQSPRCRLWPKMPLTYVVNVYSDMSLSKGHLGSRGRII